MTQDALFSRGEDRLNHDAADNSAAELTTLPTAVKKGRTPTVSILTETPEERDEVIERLGLTVRLEGSEWVAWWPEEPDTGALTLDV